MSVESDDEKERTLLYANPLGDKPKRELEPAEPYPPPRPSPGYVTAEEHRLWRLRVEALEKGQEMVLNRLTKMERDYMNGQIKTQADYKALRAENSQLLETQKQTNSLLAEIRNFVSTGPK